MPFSGRELTFFDAFSKWLLYGCPKDILRSPFSVSRSFSVPRASPCAHTPDVIPRVSLPIARSLLVTPPISKPPKFSIPSPLLFSFSRFHFCAHSTCFFYLLNLLMHSFSLFSPWFMTGNVDRDIREQK